jgi:quercetin dioxygenase-like cupin family protein
VLPPTRKYKRTIKTMTNAATDEVFDLLRAHIQFLTAVSDADDDYCVFRGVLPPGVIVPVHSHPERETFYILDGAVRAMLDNRWITLGRNDIFDVPGGARHAWRNVSSIPALAVFVVPMRLARFFREAAQPLAAVKPGPPTPEEMQRFLELTHSYGHWVGSPEDNAAIGLSLG